MYTVDLSGKNALVFGVANQRSIAWAIAQALHEAGARVALTYQNERLRESVQALASEIGEAPLFQCDMSVDGRSRQPLPAGWRVSGFALHPGPQHRLRQPR